MVMKHFPLKEGLRTKDVTGMIRECVAQACKEWNTEVKPNEEVRRAKGKRRYVFGMGTDLRDTLVAHYEVGSGEIGVVFPNGYRYWDGADSYTRLRVRAYDLIVHDLANRGHIRDVTKPAREA